MRCNVCCATSVVQHAAYDAEYEWFSVRVQRALPNLKLSAAVEMTARHWLAHRRGRASARMLALAVASYFGATDAAAVALTAGRFPAGTSVRVSDLGGR
eukprot:4293018-Pyramimonas_sp.AAC.1